jgi:GTP-binding protein HflX
VVDASDPDFEQHMSAVAHILGELELGEKPRVIAFNKCDRLSSADADRLAAAHEAIPIAAIDRSTFAPLLGRIERELWKEGHTAAGPPEGVSTALPAMPALPETHAGGHSGAHTRAAPEE